MTEKDIINENGITVVTFDGELMPDEWGFYDSVTKTAFLSDLLSEKERIKVLLHELGHVNHYPALYQHARIRCENEADRNMIHHLVKDAIQQLDDAKNFDYLKFMEFYNFKTTTEEIMIREEFLGLFNGY